MITFAKGIDEAHKVAELASILLDDEYDGIKLYAETFYGEQDTFHNVQGLSITVFAGEHQSAVNSLKFWVYCHPRTDKLALLKSHVNETEPNNQPSERVWKSMRQSSSALDVAREIVSEISICLEN